jgi:hypothetical protein
MSDLELQYLEMKDSGWLHQHEEDYELGIDVHNVVSQYCQQDWE